VKPWVQTPVTTTITKILDLLSVVSSGRKLEVPSQPRQKLMSLFLKSKPVIVGHACNPSYCRGAGRRLKDQGLYHETLSQIWTKKAKVLQCGSCGRVSS
jgi:hypothetical protein